MLREVTPTHGELYAYPKASEWSLDDIFFNVEEWLSNEVASEFAYQEGVAVINGNGTNKPDGNVEHHASNHGGFRFAAACCCCIPVHRF